MLATILGPDAHGPRWSRARSCWQVAEVHTLRVVEGLARHYGCVRVLVEGARSGECASACRAANPRSRFACACRCAGQFHGAGQTTASSADAGFVREHGRLVAVHFAAWADDDA